MIPHPVPPLRGVAVLVTRPAAQAAKLCELIRAAGGEAIEYPAIAIEPLTLDEALRHSTAPDWLIFTSVNAVQHGLAHCARNASTRVAAIGKATATALEANDVRVDAVPELGSTSEDLLSHSAFANVDGLRVWLIKGVGGRDALRDTLAERGANVTVAEAYRRVQPNVAPDVTQRLEERWRNDGIDIVTLTSVEILENLLALLSEAGQTMLRATPFVAISERIVAAARAHGLRADAVLTRGADDESIVGAIAAWHARAR